MDDMLTDFKRHRENVIRAVAQCMGRTLPVGVLAEVLNAWVTAQDDAELTAADAAIAGTMFAMLCDLRPDARDAAVNG